MKGGLDPYKRYHFLKECSKNCQMKYVNCFNRLSCFLQKSAQNCRKFTFLDKLSAITQEGDLKTRQMTFFYLPLLLCL